MPSSGEDSMDDTSIINVEKNGEEKYEPFGIESGSGREEDVANDSISVHIHKPLPQNSSPVNAADVLKTLFFILVWYTFSLFLTL